MGIVNYFAGEKPYVCDRCDRSFRQSGNLTKHLKSHDNAHLRWKRNSSDKPFKCDFPQCEKSFTAKSSLQNHLRIHHNCSASTSISLTNLKHERQKFQPAPAFLCPKIGCGKSFQSIDDLAFHDALKHKPPPLLYRCAHPNCSDHFATKTELQAHLIAFNPGIAAENVFLKNALFGLLAAVESTSSQVPAFSQAVRFLSSICLVPFLFNIFGNLFIADKSKNRRTQVKVASQWPE